MEKEATCLFCGRNSDEMPLVNVTYQSKQIWICSQHLPLLIHEPAKLAEHLKAAVKED